MQKKRIFVLLILLLCVVMLASLFSGCGQKQEVLRVSYAGCTVGGAANLVAMARASMVNEKMKDVIEITVEATGCGADNVTLVDSGELDIGQAGNTVPYASSRGLGIYEGKATENLRGLSIYYETPIHPVVLDSSSIRTIFDIKGKKVSVGVLGSGSEAMAKEMLEAIGISYEMFDAYFIPYRETLDGLKDGSLDAAFFVTGSPIPAIMELQATHTVRILPIPEAEGKKAAEGLPTMAYAVIPGGTYAGIDSDIPCITGHTISFVHKDLPDDIVYQMVKLWHENIDTLAMGHISQKFLSGQMIKDGLYPILEVHPGAHKYYKEMGWVD